MAMSGDWMAALAEKPEFASFWINLLIGLYASALAGRRQRGLLHQSPAEAGKAIVRDGAWSPAAAPWIGACAIFHLLSALLFALGLVQTMWLVPAQQAGDEAMRGPVLALLLMLCILIGFCAVSLADLAARLIEKGPPGPRRPFILVGFGFVILEVALFMLGRFILVYWVSEFSWLLACLFTTIGLLRVTGLGASGRLLAVLTALGFFGRALLALLFLLNTGMGRLLADIATAIGPIGSLVLATVAHLSILKTILVAWTGAGLLLIAGAWGQGKA